MIDDDHDNNGNHRQAAAAVAASAELEKRYQRDKAMLRSKRWRRASNAARPLRSRNAYIDRCLREGHGADPAAAAGGRKSIAAAADDFDDLADFIVA